MILKLSNERMNHLTPPDGKGLTSPVRWAGIALAGVAFLSGCGAPKPIKYYQLTNPPTTTITATQAPMKITLLVREFQTSHLYRDDRIVYGSDAQELGVYETKRWAEPPVELLQDALSRGFRSSGNFLSVAKLRTDSSAEFMMVGHIYDFREVSGSGVIARLNFEVELRDVRKGKIVWTHVYKHDEAVAGKGINDVVAAMDKNVQRSVQEIQEGMIAALNSYGVK